MKRLTFFLLSFAIFAACSAPQKGKCTIKGIISAEDKRDSCYIFLVPQGPHEASDVDSTLILGGAFEFTTEKEQMAVLRVTKYRRFGLQDLLVVTEPGTVQVEIGESSTGRGTRQNDSLQVWKNLTEQYNLDAKGIVSEEGRAAFREIYKNRSREIAHGCGDESTLGKFLLGLFPEKK
ncbi:MAG: DUF4369 domain-containing protein [Bacteroidales bacterium]|nr:DUF4369 domain-containing protein [Bacteroidales bacterium]